MHRRRAVAAAPPRCARRRHLLLQPLCIHTMCVAAALAAAAEEPESDAEYFGDDDFGLDALAVDADGSTAAVDAGGVADPGSGAGGSAKGPRRRAERHAELAQKFAERRAEQAEVDDGSSGLTFSRMATPIRTTEGRKRREIEEGEAPDSDIDSTRFYVPGKTEAKVMRKLSNCLFEVRKMPTQTYYESMDCFETAIAAFPLNSTWFKRLGTLHLLSGAPTKAVPLYNESVHVLFENAKYKTKQENMLKDGGLNFIKLFALRDNQGATEVAKLSAFNYSFRYELSNAAALYDRFLFEEHKDGELGFSVGDDDANLLWSYAEILASQGNFAAVPNILNKLASLEDHLEGLPPVLLTLRLLSDSADLTARRLLSLPLRNASKEVKKQAGDFIKKHCGRSEAPSSPTYSRATLSGFGQDCFVAQLKKEDGLLATLLKKEASVLKQDRGGFLQGSPLHFAASLGGESVELLERLVKMGVEVDSPTRFGHSALHIALSGGHYAAARALVREKASPVHKDARQLTPVEVACKHASWIDRAAVARALGDDPKEDPCDFDDDESLVLHMSKVKARKDHGGWGGSLDSLPDKVRADVEDVAGPARPLPGDTQQCHIDIRSGDMTGMDLMMDYLLLGRPVLLRACFPNKLALQFRKRDLLDAFGGMRGRAEAFPFAELYGAAGGRVTNLSQHAGAAAGPAGDPPATFTEKVPRLNKRRVAEHARSVVPRRHPLANLTAWEPPFLHFEGFSYNETHEPALHVGGAGAGAGGGVLTAAAVHVMPFGSRRWFLSPPPHAFATRRAPLDVFRARRDEWRSAGDASPLSGRSVLECQQQPGDVLVVPRDWSAVAVNTRETVAYSQALDLDALWPTFEKKEKKKRKRKKKKASGAAATE